MSYNKKRKFNKHMATDEDDGEAISKQTFHSKEKTSKMAQKANKKKLRPQ